MKRFFLIILLACLLLVGCSPDKAPQPNEKTAKPEVMAAEPTPTPTPIRIALLSDHADIPATFVKGVEQAAQAAGLITVQLEPGNNFAALKNETGFDGFILLRTMEETDWANVEPLINSNTPVCIVDITMQEEIVAPKGASYSKLDLSDAALFALGVTLSYPPHDTPVRLIALLEEKDSPAATAYSLRMDEGKIFNRGRFYQTDKQTAREFLEAMLDKYVEGMVDAIYAENIELAQTALDMLSELGRTDMEVFLVPSGSLGEQQALHTKWVFPMALGADMYTEGQNQVEAILTLIKGGEPEQRVFTPIAVEME
ncbi:hypothetical protein LJC42_07695 [Eubacteriales bacterium OttesenSCG-928-K08]|nr:hypothetical protein [Eubacteriales bacterium OttesenSCG-928-K08]